MGNVSRPDSGCNNNQLSTDEIQALIGFPDFRPVDTNTALHAGAVIFHTSETNIQGWRQLHGSDPQNIFTCLLANLNRWVDGLELARTPNGGMMQMRNSRITELISGKAGMKAPCLQDFGLSIACALLPGPQGRKWSFFRLCHSEEVLHRHGKKVPFTPPLKTGSTDRKKRTESAPTSRQSEPAQSAMFDTSNFVSYETGGRR